MPPEATAPGTMGMSLVGFLVTWSVMMAAMMLPSMAPVASRYLRSRPGWRGALFVVGYLLLWTTAGVLAWALALGADRVAAVGDDASRLFAGGVFAVGAAFTLTPFKERWLRQCRNPLGLLLRYAADRRALRDLRAGIHHGTTCLGCCWWLMALMVVFGMMNVAAMAAIGIVVAVERHWSRGIGFARAVGVASAALAAAVLVVPDLAVGLRSAA